MSAPPQAVILLTDLLTLAGSRKETTTTSLSLQMVSLSLSSSPQSSQLTSLLDPTGQLFSWGAYSAGALGLGHPQLLDTPLSAPWPPPASPRAPEPSTNMPGRFPGFAPGRTIARVPDAPEKVERPTLVRFAGDAKEALVGGERKKGKFVFAITASGWHSGALAVEIAEEAEEKEDGPRIRLRSNAEERSSQGGPPQGQPRGVFGGLVGRGFRVGLAGAGLAPGSRGVGR